MAESPTDPLQFMQALMAPSVQQAAQGQIKQAGKDIVQQAIAPSVNERQQAPLTSFPTQQRPMRDTQRERLASTQGGSAWPMILGILSAARGNVAPLFGIMERKRKTQVGAMLAPILNETQKHVSEGRFDDATTLLQNNMAQFSEAPEFLDFLKPIYNNIKEMRIKVAQGQQMAGFVQTLIDETKSTGREPSAMLEQIKENLTNPKSPVAIDTALKQLEMIRPEIRTDPSSNRNILTTAYTGKQEVLTIPVVPSKEDIGSGVYDRMLSSYGLTQDQITTIRQSGSPEQKQAMSEALGHQATQVLRFETSKSTMPGHEIIAALMSPEGGGFSAWQIAHNEFSGQDMANAIKADFQRKALLAEAPVLAQLKQNVAFLSNFQAMEFNNVKGDPNRLNPVFTSPTVAAGVANPATVIRPTAWMMEQAQTLKSAQAVFRLMEQMFEELPEIGVDAPIDRLSQGVKTILQSYGVTADPTITLRTAVDMLVDQSLNKLVGAQHIPKESVGRLKEMMIGNLRGKESALQGVQVLNQLADDIADVIAGPPKMIAPGQAEEMIDTKTGRPRRRPLSREVEQLQERQRKGQLPATTEGGQAQQGVQGSQAVQQPVPQTPQQRHGYTIKFGN